MASRCCPKCCRLHARTAFDGSKRTCAEKLTFFNLLRRRGREAQHGDARTADTPGRVLRRGTTGSLGRWRAQPDEREPPLPPPAPPALPLPPLPPLVAPWFDASDAALFGDDVISLEALLTADAGLTATNRPHALVARCALQRPLPGAPSSWGS